MTTTPKRKVTLVVVALACLFLASEPAAADVLLFQSRTDFIAGAPPLSTETFDTFAPGTIFNTQSVVINGVTYESDQTGNSWNVGINLGSIGHVSPPNDFGSNLLGTVRIGFGAGSFVNSFGFEFLSSSGSPHAFDVTVTEVNGQSEVFTVLSGQPSVYFGFLSDTGIFSLTIANAPNPIQFNFSFDDVSRSDILPVAAAVPEAGTLAMLCGSLSGLAALLRVRRGRASRSDG